MKTSEYIHHLILRVLEGEELSISEHNELLCWLKDHPEDQLSLAEMTNVWLKLDVDRELSEEVIAERWNQLHAYILDAPSAKKPARNSNRWIAIQRYAAVFLIGMIVASGLFWGLNIWNNEELAMLSVEVPLGAKSTVKLTDGTEVILNAGSKLQYASNYGENTRQVYLEGEGYFKVTKNPNKPFVVNTSDLTVKAYGTIFNVKSYTTDRHIEATLIEGSISVQKLNKVQYEKSKEFFLEPRQQAIFHKAIPGINKEKLFISKSVDPNLCTSWIDDRIQVSSMPLKELVVLLERKYNVTVHIESEELEDLKFSGILENETIEQVMYAIQIASPVHYKIKNRKIWLTK